MILATSFSLFIGRFHPLFVHLPIGFILLAVLLEYVNRKQENTKTITRFAWLLSAISAFFAVACGWLLAAEGGYEADTLFWHRWLGILLMVITFFIWLSKTDYVRIPPQAITGLTAGLVLLMMITGHLGGNLTHGSGYLTQHAPVFVQSMLGANTSSTSETAQLDIAPDSVLVFQDLIQPILNEKCLSCHNPDKMKGGLLLDSPENMFKGGDHGAVIATGKSFESELIHRVTMSRNDPLFMPPKGEPLSYRQTKLIEWWINSGAPLDQHLSAYASLDEDVQALLMQEYQLDTRQKPYLETVEVPELAQTAMQKIQQEGFEVLKISQVNGFVEVTAKNKVNKDMAEKLLEAQKQITWLNLGKTSCEDDVLEVLGKFPNLTRLRLEGNPVTDAGIQHLQQLEHLESLNLYNTQITDKALEYIQKLPSLKRLYLWQTDVSEESIAQLQKDVPGLTIIQGFQFSQAESTPES